MVLLQLLLVPVQVSHSLVDDLLVIHINLSRDLEQLIDNSRSILPPNVLLLGHQVNVLVDFLSSNEFHELFEGVGGKELIVVHVHEAIRSYLLMQGFLIFQ